MNDGKIKRHRSSRIRGSYEAGSGSLTYLNYERKH